MTPFDPDALLAMLLAFYPDVSAAALARAMRERPEYFAGGVAVGHSGDAFRLPDGRVWDAIFDVENQTGRRHWQMIMPGAGGAADPFPLEDGPLSPIDPASFITPMPRVDFTDLVGQAFDDLRGHHTLLDGARTTIVEHSTSTRIEAASALYLEPAAAAHGAHEAGFDAANPIDVIGATAAQDGPLAVHRSDYDDPDPANFVPVDPGPIPPHGPTQPPEKD